MSDEEPWRPLSKREAGAPPDPLAEGVPDWLVRSVVAWLDVEYRDPKTHRVRPDRLNRLERSLRRSFWGKDGSDGESYNAIWRLVREDPLLFLDVLDATLATHYVALPGKPTERARRLEAALSEGGSAWEVVERGGVYGLGRRVPAEVKVAADQVMSEGNRAGEHLRRGWEALYGRHPRPGEAYREAVRAVEAAARPVVTPEDGRATLGKIIPALRDAPSKWQATLEPLGADPVEVVADMLGLLWRSQYDRHGTDDESVPIEMLEQEAEAAVHLAVTLVHWFRSGFVSRRT